MGKSKSDSTFAKQRRTGKTVLTLPSLAQRWTEVHQSLTASTRRTAPLKSGWGLCPTRLEEFDPLFDTSSVDASAGLHAISALAATARIAARFSCRNEAIQNFS